MYICGRVGVCTGVQVPEDARGVRSAWNWSYRRWELGLDEAQGLCEESARY